MRNGAGIGCVVAYLVIPDVATGRLVHVLPDLSPPPIEVSILFPSNRELPPVVRALVDFLKRASRAGPVRQDDPVRAGMMDARSA